MTFFLAATSPAGESFWEKIAAWYQNSLLRELLTYFEQRYFTVDFRTYNNFTITSQTTQMIRNMVLAILIGILLASLYVAYMRSVPGGFVRALLREGADTPEKAKTLRELGYFRSPMIRRELTVGNSLRMVVRYHDPKDLSVETEEQNAQMDAKKHTRTLKTGKKLDFLSARFYIPEELHYRADIRFDSKGSGWRFAIVVAVASVIVAALICIFLPDILTLVDGIISLAAPK